MGPLVIGIGFGLNGLIGADHGAHTAADASVLYFCFLPDSNKGTKLAGAFAAGGNIQTGHALPSIGKIDCLGGAHCGAPAAQGAAVFPVGNDPGQVYMG